MPRGLLAKERALLELGLAFRAPVQVFGLPVILSALLGRRPVFSEHPPIATGRPPAQR